MSRFTAFTLAALLMVAIGPGARRLEAQVPDEESPAAAAAAADDEEKSPPRRQRRRPRVDSSNTGYIDSAVIASQVRFRFDSARNADRPDRAEFIYGKCICWNQLEGQTTADAPGLALDLDYQDLSLLVERAVGERWSFFGEVSLRQMDLFFLDFGNGRGGAETTGDFGLDVGDLQLGFKRALVAREASHLTFKLTAYLPTGDRREGLGTGHSSVEPGLLYRQSLGGGRATFESELKVWIPLSGSSDPVTGLELDDAPDDVFPYRFFKFSGKPDPIDNDGFAGEIVRFGLGLSFDSAPASKLRPTPVVELVGWHLLSGYATTPIPPFFFEDVSGDTIANLKVGLRLRGPRGDSWYLGYGFAVTEDVWYEDILRLEYRLGF